MSVYFRGKQLAFESAKQQSHACTKRSMSQERAGGERFYLSEQTGMLWYISSQPALRLDYLYYRADTRTLFHQICWSCHFWHSDLRSGKPAFLDLRDCDYDLWEWDFGKSGVSYWSSTSLNEIYLST